MAEFDMSWIEMLPAKYQDLTRDHFFSMEELVPSSKTWCNVYPALHRSYQNEQREDRIGAKICATCRYRIVLQAVSPKMGCVGVSYVRRRLRK